MPYVRRMFYDQNIGSGSSSFNLGPYDIGIPLKIFQIKVAGGSADPSASVPSLTNFGVINSWGVQMVAHGSPPLFLVGNEDNSVWLWNSLIQGEEAIIAWAPNTDTAEVAVQTSLKWQWNGQMPVPNHMDLYLSFGDPYAFGSTGAVAYSIGVLSAA